MSTEGMLHMQGKRIRNFIDWIPAFAGMTDKTGQKWTPEFVIHIGFFVNPVSYFVNPVSYFVIPAKAGIQETIGQG
jgi:hypothetical protein